MRSILFSIAMLGICASTALAKPVMPAVGQIARATAPAKVAPNTVARPPVLMARWDPCRPHGPDYYCQ